MISITARFQIESGSAEQWPRIAAGFTQATRAEPPHLAAASRAVEVQVDQDDWFPLGEMAGQ